MPGAQVELRRGANLSTKSTGDRGEEIATRYLLWQGYELICKNYRTRRGEIDLILRQGKTLVFVEVKLRRGAGFGEPAEAVTARKQATIRSVAEEYLVKTRPDFEELRFDVIGILAGPGSPEITHIEEAF